MKSKELYAIIKNINKNVYTYLSKNRVVIRMIKSMAIKIIISFIAIILLANIFYIPASHAEVPIGPKPGPIEIKKIYNEENKSKENTSEETLNPDDYKPDNLQASEVQGLGVYGGKIAGFIRIIGTIVSVGALMIIGIKFMLGSAEEKAEYKDRMYPYIIGAVLLFAASNFVDIIYGLAKNM